MYKDLPNHLQEQVKQYLKANKFPKAKAVHDAWMAKGEVTGHRHHVSH